MALSNQDIPLLILCNSSLKKALNENIICALCELTSKGKHNSQKILNALILLNCDKSEWNVNHSTNEEISRILNISMRKIDRVKKRFVEEGLSAALERKERETPPREIQFGGEFEAHLLALACSEAPEGKNRWTVRLLAEKMVELKMVPSVSPMTVCNTLKKMNLSLTKANTGRYRRMKTPVL